MNYRKAVLLDNEAESAAGTRVINLNMTNPISKLTISYKGLNSSSTPLAHPAAMLPKIQIVDGSDVLTGLSGYEAQALDFYQTGQLPVDILNYIATAYAVATVNIYFGTKLYDPNLAFDPTKFSNPQLQITHDYTKGGSTGSSGILTVEADMFDDKTISPSGFLMAKELNSTLLVNNAKTPVTFPSDYKLRMLMLQSLSAGKQPWEQYNHLKFSYNAGAKVIFDMQTSDLIKSVVKNLGRTKEGVIGSAATTGTPHFIASTYEVFAAFAELAGYTVTYGNDQSYGGSLKVYGSATNAFNGVVNGYCPHGAVAIPLGMLDDLNDWFDIAPIKSLELDITAGGAVGSTSYVNTVLQQLRTP